MAIRGVSSTSLHLRGGPGHVSASRVLTLCAAAVALTIAILEPGISRTLPALGMLGVSLFFGTGDETTLVSIRARRWFIVYQVALLLGVATWVILVSTG